MAEETVKSEEVVAVVEKAETETPKEETNKTAEAVTTTEETTKAAEEAEEAKLEAEVAKEEAQTVAQSVSFKEETNVVADLPDPQTKALDELKDLIRDALNKREFVTIPPPPPPPPPAVEEKPAATEVKKEVAVATVTEEVVKVEETATTSTEAVKKEEEAPEAAETETKEEEEKKVEVAPPETEEKAPETAVVLEVVETVAAVVDEDGVKTVEAIEETIVAVSTTTPEAETKEEEPPVAAATEDPEAAEAEPIVPEEASIWGIPLLADERTDVILLKFLRARDFKVKEAFTMIRSTVRWRKEFKIDELVEEDLGNNELDKVVFMKGFDKEGHPVCYNIYGEFQNKDLYNNTLADEEKRLKFLRWRIQFLEKSIRKLDFSPSGVSTIVQVNDMKNSPGLTDKGLRLATNQALALLQDNYPEFVAKQVFINVPWWYLAYNRMISPFLTQRTKSKMVFAGPSRTADTLFKYIAPEQVPIQYGGVSGDQEAFTTTDAVTEVAIKPASKHTIEFPFAETGSLVWELRVVGWDVSYGAEFVPTAEESYTVIVQKTRKILPTDEPIISNTFKVGEPGKVILTVDNQSSKKKKLLYRSKTTPISE